MYLSTNNNKLVMVGIYICNNKVVMVGVYIYMLCKHIYIYIISATF